ncbi:hypothetical protein [Kitasatospora sp. NBC_01266]|uniref:hypothetical protein n=1 Tax=Kitasatospora sp. NBC_01266 TaxID=2903572 RepID=UPI002E2EDA7E|nr:hypothetical protein [Kitasatospora sp. NBC_01266]
MNKHFAQAQAQLAAVATDETLLAAGTVDAVAEDPAGGITLSGRNRVCARALVLAGLVLTSGVVVALGGLDTSVSAPMVL